jgi:hypothetical protein
MSTYENKIVSAKNLLENNLDLDFNPKSAIAFESHSFIIIFFHCSGKPLKTVQFCSRPRKAKVLTTVIH